MHYTQRTLFFILFFIFTVTVVAQSMGGGLPFRGKEKLQQFRKLRLIEALDLKEENAIRFFAKLNEHEKRMNEFHDRRSALADTLEILVKADASDKSLERIFDDLLGVEEKMMQEKKTFRSELKNVLTTQQAAKLFVFEKKFGEGVRNAMQDKFREDDMMPRQGEGKRRRNRMGGD
jgi:hypothetical protein